MGCGGSKAAGEEAAVPEVTKLDGCELKKASAVADGEYTVIDDAACKITSAKTIPTQKGDVTYLKGEDVFTGGLKIVKVAANSNVNVPEVTTTSYTMNDADEEGMYVLVGEDGTERNELGSDDVADRADKADDVKLKISKALLEDAKPKLTVVKTMGVEKIVSCSM